MAQRLQFFEVTQVYLVGYALPDETPGRGVGGEGIDTEEGVALAAESFHKGDALFVERGGAEVVVGVAHGGRCAPIASVSRPKSSGQSHCYRGLALYRG